MLRIGRPPHYSSLSYPCLPQKATLQFPLNIGRCDLPVPRVNRRAFVFGLGSTATSAWVAAHLPALRVIAAHAAMITPAQAYDFFTPEQARDFDAISSQIVPTDDTPGAREAHVVRFADRFVATVGKNWQQSLQDDFKLLGDAVARRTSGKRAFAVLSDNDQFATLIEFEKAQRDAFDDFRDLTMLGMFSHPMHGGNFGKAGWKLIGFEDRGSWAAPFGYYDRV